MVESWVDKTSNQADFCDAGWSVSPTNDTCGEISKVSWITVRSCCFSSVQLRVFSVGSLIFMVDVLLSADHLPSEQTKGREVTTKNNFTQTEQLDYCDWVQSDMRRVM